MKNNSHVSALFSALLIVGLVGVYGFMQAIPIGVPAFWQAFFVVFLVFTAVQHFLPKTQQLLRERGAKAVVIATVVGILLLAPMFVAVGLYAFQSAALWA